jgi:hypothetical protein
MDKDETIIIQKKIDEAIKNEFEEMIRNNKDPLIKLIVENRYKKPSLKEVKEILRLHHDE